MVMVLDIGNGLKTDANARGMAGGGKYLVHPYTFPQDLFSAGPKKYANAWMMININVMSQGRIGKIDGLTVELAENEKRRFTNIDARANSVGGFVGTAMGTGALVGGASKFSLGDAIKDGLALSKKGASRVGAATGAALNQAGQVAGGAIQGSALGLAAAYPVISSDTAMRETKRLIAAIQFPMPNNLQTSYSMEWGEDSTDILDMIMRAPQLGAQAITGLMTGDLQSFKGATGAVGDAAAAASLKTQSFLGSGGISAASGLAANPKKEQIFNGVNFREFTIDYKFYPKDEQEAVYLMHYIIPLLKYHMHPEYKSEGRFTFIYPSEFDITFYVKGEENIWINKIATCVLRNMSVNYTPEGNWVSHESGMPNTLTLSLTFKELSILTKETIEKGF